MGEDSIFSFPPFYNRIVLWNMTLHDLKEGI